LAQTLFGVTTYYRREEDGSLSIKLEGVIEGVPLYEQVAVLREVDLHSKWAPFCSSSLTVAHLDKLDTVGWFAVGLPNFGLMRDGCFRAIGCDSIAEDGSILLVGKGIADIPPPSTSQRRQQKQQQQQQQPTTPSLESHLSSDPILEQLDLPDPPTRLGSGRLTIKTFHATIHIESPTSARTKIITNINPNLPLLPQSLLDFIMKKLCGVLLIKLQNAAKKIVKDPVANPHARKMRQEEDFYKVWLRAKFEGVCVARGWTMPPIAAFDLTEQQFEQAALVEEKALQTSSRRFYHSSKSDDKFNHRASALRTTNSNVMSEPSCVGRQGAASLEAAAASPRQEAYQSHSNSNSRHGSSYQDSDSMSELSLNSSSSLTSVWKNNPLALYLRDLEEKTQLLKARTIEEGRLRASKRLQPKQLDPVAQTRLDELRAAKQQRRENEEYWTKKAVIPFDATKSQKKLIQDKYTRDWATMWTRHQMSTRIVVTLLLTASLFAILHIDTLSGSFSPLQMLLLDNNGPWWHRLGRDVGVICYMGFSAVVHFSLCYVALMYAFSGLQLGKLAGQQAKKFYSENVHLIVAAGSGSMVVLGLLRALFMAILRNSIFYSMVIWSKVVGTVNPVSNGMALIVPDNLEPLLVMVLNLYNNIYGIVARLLSLAFRVVHKLVFDSNSVGRLLASAILSVHERCARSNEQWHAYIDDLVDRFEGRVERYSWREQAFDGTRAMLAYSAIFLLALLVLFNLYARKVRMPDEKEGPEDQAVATSIQSSDSLSAPSSLPITTSTEPLDSSGRKVNGRPRSAPKSAAYSTQRSLPPYFDAIEEESHNQAAEEASILEAKSATLLATSSSALEEKKRALEKKKRRGFRFRGRSSNHN
jgi:hypothetical protein